MYGPTIGSLRVYVNASGQTTAHWIKYGDQGNQWRKTTVGIGKQNNPFRVIIEGKRATQTEFLLLIGHQWSQWLPVIMETSDILDGNHDVWINIQAQLKFEIS